MKTYIATREEFARAYTCSSFSWRILWFFCINNFVRLISKHDCSKKFSTPCNMYILILDIHKTYYMTFNIQLCVIKNAAALLVFGLWTMKNWEIFQDEDSSGMQVESRARLIYINVHFIVVSCEKKNILNHRVNLCVAMRVTFII